MIGRLLCCIWIFARSTGRITHSRHDEKRCAIADNPSFPALISLVNFLGRLDTSISKGQWPASHANNAAIVAIVAFPESLHLRVYCFHWHVVLAMKAIYTKMLWR